MINLKNGYGIVSDGKSYTLIQYAIQTSKNGEEKEKRRNEDFRRIRKRLSGKERSV